MKRRKEGKEERRGGEEGRKRKRRGLSEGRQGRKGIKSIVKGFFFTLISLLDL